MPLNQLNECLLFCFCAAGLAFASINCKQGEKTYSDLGALITVCTLPCSRDESQQCCLVPASIAKLFPCCRSLGCCKDQQRSRRGLQGVAVSATVPDLGSTLRGAWAETGFDICSVRSRIRRGVV